MNFVSHFNCNSIDGSPNRSSFVLIYFYFNNYSSLVYLYFQGCTNAPEPVSSCLSKEFKCPDHLTCIHQTWVCDGDPDCPDGADESPQLCTNLTCRPDQFQCSSRQCIPGHFHCNGQSDCVDGSDEQDCGNLLYCVIYLDCVLFGYKHTFLKGKVNILDIIIF